VSPSHNHPEISHLQKIQEMVDSVFFLHTLSKWYLGREGGKQELAESLTEEPSVLDGHVVSGSTANVS
jgi:hypothetical protein